MFIKKYSLIFLSFFSFHVIPQKKKNGSISLSKKQDGDIRLTYKEKKRTVNIIVYNYFNP